MTFAGRALTLDIQTLQTGQYRDRGIPRFVQAHAAALMDTGRVAMLSLNPSWPFPPQLRDQLAHSPLLRWGTAAAFNELDADRLAHLVMCPFELEARADAIVPPALRHRDALLAVTLYDLIPHIYRDRYLGDPARRRRYDTRVRLVESADVVLAISEQTRRDAIDRLGVAPDRVTNIGAGVSSFFRPATDDDAPRALVRASVREITRPFVLCVSGEDNNRKNIESLFAAYAALPPSVRAGFQLVVACTLSNHGRKQWSDAARHAGLRSDEVVLTGFVDDETLRALYQTATLSIAPSLYEGFGLPAFEAVACGCPTIGSRTSALPDLVDHPAAIFDPTDVGQMSAALAANLVDDDARASLAAAQFAGVGRFTWHEVAARTLAAVDGAPAPRSVRAPRRARIAILAPLPPTLSGVADYSAHVIPALSAIADVDVFSAGDVSPAPLLCESRVRPTAAFELHTTPAAYDGVIYVVGNNHSHRDIVDIASRVPGLVWLHDTRLAGLALSVHAHSFDPGLRKARKAMLEQLERQYGARLLPELIERWNEPALYDDHGLGVTGDLVSGAQRVLVNSAHAEHLVRLDQKPTARDVPITVLPFGVRQPSVALTSIVKQRNRVVAPGWMDWIKQPELVVRALACVRRSEPVVSLVFVGYMRDEVQRELRHLAETLHVDVRFLGHVSEAEYWQTLAAAECAVVLRKTSHGESSATVNDALAAGTPVITNAPSAVAVPLEAVTLVESDADETAIAAAILAMLADPRVPAVELPNFADVAAALLEVVERTRRENE